MKSKVPDSSLAARELSFLVRLAQAAASTQFPPASSFLYATKVPFFTVIVM